MIPRIRDAFNFLMVVELGAGERAGGSGDGGDSSVKEYVDAKLLS